MNLRLRYTLLLLLCLTMQSCAKKTTGSAAKSKTPECLSGKINDWKEKYCESGKSVKEYTFQNKSVYVFTPGTCGADMQTIVLDASCKELGALGGILGNTKINGEDFSTATYVKTIWSN